MKTILTIAGSDSSAGAGIQQDLKTVTALGGYCATVITAVTSQNTLGVQGVMPVTADVVRSQIRSVMDDLDVATVKIGMIPNIDVAIVITEELRNWKNMCHLDSRHIVIDPVMLSTSGTRLMAEECIEYIKSELFPLCTLVTPNIPESLLLPPPYCTNFLIKGGHSDSDIMTDTLYCMDGKVYEFSSKRIKTTNLHGTGCTLSSAIATLLAQGLSLYDAVKRAKHLIDKGIEKGRNLNIGKGNGPLWMF